MATFETNDDPTYVMGKQEFEDLLNRRNVVPQDGVIVRQEDGNIIRQHRRTPSRRVMLRAWECTHGKDCLLELVKQGGDLSEENRDKCALEIYRKLTGNTTTPDRVLLPEFEMAKKRGHKPPTATWLDERPSCIQDFNERLDHMVMVDELKELLEMQLAVPPAQRRTPTRRLLLHAFQCTHGKGCLLGLVKIGAFSNDERDMLSIEIYRKWTGDEMTADFLLKSEMAIIAKRRFGAAKNPSSSLTRWLNDRPGCVSERAEFDSPVGHWHPRKASQLSAAPPAAGSVAANAAFAGKKSGAFSSTTVSAGVPILAKDPFSGYGGVYDAKQEKLNRTPHPMQYDTTNRNMAAKFPLTESQIRLMNDPQLREACDKRSISRAGKKEDLILRLCVAEREIQMGHAQGGRSMTRASGSGWVGGGFSSTTVRDDVTAPKDPTTGPRKSAVGRVVRNPRRQLQREEAEHIGLEQPMRNLADVPWLNSLDSFAGGETDGFNRSFYRPAPVTEFTLDIEEREAILERRKEHLKEQFQAEVQRPPDNYGFLRDGSLVVETHVSRDPAYSSRPKPMSPEAAHRRPLPKPGNPPLPLLPKRGFGPTFDPWMLKKALKAAFGQRIIDLFRDWDEDGSGCLALDEFRDACRTDIELKKWMPSEHFKIHSEHFNKDVETTFKWLDVDRSGELDLLEVDKTLRRLPASVEELRAKQDESWKQQEEWRLREAMYRGVWYDASDHDKLVFASPASGGSQADSRSPSPRLQAASSRSATPRRASSPRPSQRPKHRPPAPVAIPSSPSPAATDAAEADRKAALKRVAMLEQRTQDALQAITVLTQELSGVLVEMKEIRQVV